MLICSQTTPHVGNQSSKSFFVQVGLIIPQV